LSVMMTRLRTARLGSPTRLAAIAPPLIKACIRKPPAPGVWLGGVGGGGGGAVPWRRSRHRPERPGARTPHPPPPLGVVWGGGGGGGCVGGFTPAAAGIVGLINYYDATPPPPRGPHGPPPPPPPRANQVTPPTPPSCVAKTKKTRKKGQGDFAAPFVPLFSLATAGFFPRRRAQTQAIRRSPLRLPRGRMVCLSARARLAFHGVDRIRPATLFRRCWGSATINLTCRRARLPILDQPSRRHPPIELAGIVLDDRDPADPRTFPWLSAELRRPSEVARASAVRKGP